MWSNMHFKTLWLLCNEWITRGKKRGHRETWETCNNLDRNDGSLEYGGDSGDEEKWIDLEYILEVETRGCATWM